MKTVKVSLPEKLATEIQKEAEGLGLTPAQLIRVRTCEVFRNVMTGGAEKSYIVKLENWREVEAYIKIKYPGSTLAAFAGKLLSFETRRCPLKPAQRAEFDRLLGK